MSVGEKLAVARLPAASDVTTLVGPLCAERLAADAMAHILYVLEPVPIETWFAAVVVAPGPIAVEFAKVAEAPVPIATALAALAWLPKPTATLLVPLATLLAPTAVAFAAVACRSEGDTP